MKLRGRIVRQLPGWIASGLMIVFTTFWTFWGAAEMYHEGWWGAWHNRLPYLVPIAVTLIPMLVAFRWPIVGGVLIVAVGVFALFMFGTGVAVIGLLIALVGAAFVVDGIVKRRAGRREVDAAAPSEWRLSRSDGAPSEWRLLKGDGAPSEWRLLKSGGAPWWRRRWRYLLAIGVPLLVFAGVSVNMLPVVLTRVDDGDRGARLIEGHGVTLVWAPQGPGWNWKQPWGGYPSWQSVALYGVPPVGLGDKAGYGRQGDDPADYVFATGEDMAATNLCRYLGADGMTLMDEPQDVWLMPTTDEVVRSLGRHGRNAGCEWDGEIRRQAPCDTLPDKESPLWATDHPAIYYWTADSYSEERGYFVAYNGTVNATYKPGGNPRHSYRCVREP